MAKKSMISSAQDTIVDAAKAGLEGVRTLAGGAADAATSTYEKARALVGSKKTVAKKKATRKVKKLAKKAKATKKVAKKTVHKTVKKKLSSKRRGR